MTEHNVEELDRQYQAAVSRRDEAQRATEAAYARLQAAHLQATGLANHLVRGQRWDSSPQYTFLVERLCGWGNNEVRGRILKKDGTLGEKIIEMPITRVTDLGEMAP